MPSLKRSILAAFDDFRASGLLRPAAEKFAGAWLACFLVMARVTSSPGLVSSTFVSPQSAGSSARRLPLPFLRR